MAMIQHSPLVCLYPCHNQAVERQTIVVTEVSRVLHGMERRDGQHVKSLNQESS